MCSSEFLKEKSTLCKVYFINSERYLILKCKTIAMNSTEIWNGKNYIIYIDHILYREDNSKTFRQYQYQDLVYPDSYYIASFPQFDLCDWILNLKGLLLSFFIWLFLLSYSVLFGFLFLVGIIAVIFSNFKYRRIYFHIKFKDGVEIFDLIFKGDKKEFADKAKLIQNTITGYASSSKQSN